MRVLVVTPPEPFVGLEEAKQHLKVQHDVENALIGTYIEAACSHIDGVEGWLGRAIGEQVLELRLPSFGCVSIGLPYPPAISIESIDYVDQAGGQTTLPPEGFELAGNLLRPAWPRTFPAAQWRGAASEAVRIRYRAGYATVPAAIRVAVLMIVEDLYRNRGNVTAGTRTRIEMPATSEALLQPFRVYA